MLTVNQITKNISIFLHLVASSHANSFGFICAGFNEYVNGKITKKFVALCLSKYWLVWIIHIQEAAEIFKTKSQKLGQIQVKLSALLDTTEGQCSLSQMYV